MFNVNHVIFKDFIRQYQDVFFNGDEMHFTFYCADLTVNVCVEFDVDSGRYIADLDTEYDGALHTTGHFAEGESAKDCIKDIKRIAKEIYKSI